jgi:hypothetical protein
VKYYFHPSAESEYLSQIAYYEEKRAGLGAYFVSDFERTVSKVSTKPSMYKQVDENLYLVSLQVFPFNLLYQMLNDQPQILAVAHKRRKPNYWQDRQ